MLTMLIIIDDKDNDNDTNDSDAYDKNDTDNGEGDVLDEDNNNNSNNLRIDKKCQDNFDAYANLKKKNKIGYILKNPILYYNIIDLVGQV